MFFGVEEQLEADELQAQLGVSREDEDEEHVELEELEELELEEQLDVVDEDEVHEVLLDRLLEQEEEEVVEDVHEVVELEDDSEEHELEELLLHGVGSHLTRLSRFFLLRLDAFCFSGSSLVTRNLDWKLMFPFLLFFFSFYFSLPPLTWPLFFPVPVFQKLLRPNTFTFAPFLGLGFFMSGHAGSIYQWNHQKR
jgi:hypothetical protein